MAQYVSTSDRCYGISSLCDSPWGRKIPRVSTKGGRSNPVATEAISRPDGQLSLEDRTRNPTGPKAHLCLVLFRLRSNGQMRLPPTLLAGELRHRGPRGVNDDS